MVDLSSGTGLTSLVSSAENRSQVAPRERL